MSTASKTKSKDKKITNALQKTPSKASGSMVASTGVLPGAYNPLLGTFQTYESGSSSLHNNGRFRNIEESDSTGADCDSISNNGSWSGDSEDHKEKVTNTPSKQEIIPGADNDKREKTRLKNERKHQRQKEKRAQELHERCCQYLMSRKLEVLAQQLIAMGISHERATKALMLNEGKLEESINWLFDDDNGVKEEDKQLDSLPRNLKLDISQELSSILEMETNYKFTKQDVERAVISAEGDIEKTEESLRKQKQEQQSTTSRKSEITGNNTSVNNIKPPCAPLQPEAQAHPINGESGNQNVNSLDRIHMKLQWLKLQQQNTILEEKKLISQVPLQSEESVKIASLNDKFKPVMLMQQQSQSNVLPISTMNPSFTGPAASNGWYNPEPARTLIHNNLKSKSQMYTQVNNRSAAISVTPAASLGLFSRFGSGSSSGLDWNRDGSIGQLDYNKIDWSLDKGLANSKPNEEYMSAFRYKPDMDEKTRTTADTGLVGNGREWTSPFEGKDMFSLSRHYVHPSL